MANGVIPQNPLDVLAQHLVSMAALDEWEIDEVERLVRSAQPFSELSREQLENVLDMLDGRYPSERFAELRPRIVWDRTKGTMRGRPGARQLVVAVIDGEFVICERPLPELGERLHILAGAMVRHDPRVVAGRVDHFRTEAGLVVLEEAIGDGRRSHIGQATTQRGAVDAADERHRELIERMKQHIHGMEALHDFKPWRPLFAHSDRAKLRKLEDDFPNPWHPVVRVHPVSGRRVLYVNQQFCVRIKDLKTDESDTLLHFLYRQATIPEYQLRVKWKPNTLVMWDNRSVQHYAAHDYYPARRTMERLTVKGDRPMGVSGAYVPDSVAANGTTKPAIAEGTRPGPKRAFDRY